MNEIDVSGGAVRSVACADGYRHDCTELLSSMPLRELVSALKSHPPDDVRDAADNLACRDFITVAELLFIFSAVTLADLTKGSKRCNIQMRYPPLAAVDRGAPETSLSDSPT